MQQTTDQDKSRIFGLGPGLKAAVLANASSGLRRRTAEAVDAAAEALARHGVYPRVFLARRGRLGEALTACRLEEPDLLIVIGGDGTILSAAEAFLGSRTVLAIVPGGTVNQLARDLGLSLDPVAAVDQLAAGTIRHIDVGTVNGRAFLCTAVVGPLAKLQRYREEARGRLWATFGSFFVTGLKAVTLRPATLKIHHGAEAWVEETRGVIVSVNPLAETVSRVPLRERLDGGTLAVYAARERGYFSLFRMAAAILAGRARTHPHVGYHEAEELQIDARRRSLIVLNDGEVRRLATPLRLAVQAGALRVVAPSESSDAAPLVAGVVPDPA
ncbi:Diacylglycerol kinase [bacterium YEK0313]|nr:Diacylglycerol kinase [bacterium YEK0313]